MTNDIRLENARHANPAALSFARVELYNICEKGRAVGNGWLLRRYMADGRGTGAIKRYGRDEAACRAAALLWNGPEADSALNPR